VASEHSSKEKGDAPNAPDGGRPSSDAGDNRGREATTPGELPKPGWKDILKRTKDDVRRDHVTIVAAGVAFFCLLGIVPTIAALISIYGLVSDPAQVQQQFESLRGVMPGEAYKLLNEQMQNIAKSSTAAGWGAVLGILLALWGGSKAVKALIDALNIMYHEDEKRGAIKLTMTAVLLTVAGVVIVAIAVGLIAILPAVLQSIGLGKSTETLISALRWPLLLILFLTALNALYRYGPSRDEPRWKWVTWGAVVATGLWLGVSWLFSLYVTHFGNYNKTYGSLGAVVILLMWFYVSAYVILLGAELNSEMERQTARDTTEGKPERMGKRGAFSADTLGEARS
jgi:membrane protein